jgi:hypothetical protein
MHDNPHSSQEPTKILEEKLKIFKEKILEKKLKIFKEKILVVSRNIEIPFLFSNTKKFKYTHQGYNSWCRCSLAKPCR